MLIETQSFPIIVLQTYNIRGINTISFHFTFRDFRDPLIFVLFRFVSFRFDHKRVCLLKYFNG